MISIFVTDNKNQNLFNGNLLNEKKDTLKKPSDLN